MFDDDYDFEALDEYDGDIEELETPANNFDPEDD